MRRLTIIELGFLFTLFLSTSSYAQPFFKGVNCGSQDFAYASPEGLFDIDVEYDSLSGLGYGYMENNSFIPPFVRVWGGTAGLDTLYYSRREGEFSYVFEVRPGTYAVNLYLFEKVYYWKDLRVFSIVVEGDTLVQNLDIFEKTGRSYSWVVHLLVECNDDLLNIDFIPDLAETVIAGISVRSVMEDITPPDQIQNFHVISGYEMNILYWDWVIAEDLAGYNVYRREPAGQWQLLTTEANPQYRYIDSTATPGIQYEYSIASIDLWGNESILSDVLSATAVLNEETDLPRYELFMTEEALYALNSDIWSEVYIDVDLILEGDYFPGSGIRRRGSTARELDKASFKLKLPLGEQHNGRWKFNENSDYLHPSLMRERIAVQSIDLLNCLNPLSQTIHLELNGSFYGVYLDIEQVDNYFLLRNGLSQSGNLYRVMDEILQPLPTYQLYVELYVKKNNEGSDHYDVIEFIEWLNHCSQSEFEENIGDKIALDQYIDMYSALISIANQDFAGEFYMYINPADNRWHFIPRDLNESFEVSALEINAGTSDAYFWGDTTMYNRLINRVLTIDVCKYAYCKKLERFLNGAFSINSMTNWINGVHDSLEFDAHRDIYKYGWERPDYFDLGHLELIDFVEERVPYLLDTIPDFIPNIDLMPYFRLNEAQSNNQSTIADEMGDYDPWIEIYNLSYVELDLENFTLHFGQNSWTFPQEAVVNEYGHLVIWLDGETNEGPLHSSIILPSSGGMMTLESNYGSFVDSTTIPLLAADEVWARTGDGIGAWSSALSPTPGSINNPVNYQVLVINEFLARNDSANPDPSGDFDDWLEIYNTSAIDTIPLGGVYLTDDFTIPFKWVLPDTTILPNRFILVWCDEEPIEGKMHATFKLSGSGEEIALYEPDGITPISVLTYGPQFPDISYGRYPDGSEDWVFANPTPGGPNEPVGVQGDNGSPTLPKEFSLEPNYPNPFNPATTIKFGLPKTAYVNLKVYNILGKEVAVLKDEEMKAGYHSVVFDGDGLASGIYFFRIEAGEFISTRKMVLVK